MTASLHTLGCKLNQSETNAIQRDLDICKKCLTDDLKEMSEVIKQLAKLRGMNA